MASINEIIAAKKDADLIERLQTAAELSGIDIAVFNDRITQLLGAEITVNGEKTTIADVYTYARTVHAQAVAALPPEPGKNSAAVTDAHINAALVAIRGE